MGLGHYTSDRLRSKLHNRFQEAEDYETRVPNIQKFGA